MVKEEEKEFEMKNEYWEITIEKADSLKVKFEIEFSNKVIPPGQIKLLEAMLEKVLEACGRLASLRPSKR